MDLLEKINQSYNFLNTEIKSVSDRACAIVCGAFLDNLMQELLLEFLCKDSKTQDNKLFSQNGPLATFSSKILLAYRLGLISKYEYDCLNLIRKIRNSFAHDLTIDSFECESIRELLSNNLPPIELMPPISIPLSYDDNGTIVNMTVDDFLDDCKYKSLIPKFPPLEFRRYEKDNMRSVFLSIVYVLQALLPIGFINAVFEKRKSAKEFKTIEDIETYKIQYIRAHNDNQIERLKLMRERTEFEIDKIEFEIDKIEFIIGKKDSTASIDYKIREIRESALKLKDKRLNELSKINTLVEEFEIGNIEFATMKYVLELIKYNRKGMNN